MLRGAVDFWDGLAAAIGVAFANAWVADSTAGLELREEGTALVEGLELRDEDEDLLEGAAYAGSALAEGLELREEDEDLLAGAAYAGSALMEGLELREEDSALMEGLEDLAELIGAALELWEAEGMAEWEDGVAIVALLITARRAAANARTFIEICLIFYNFKIAPAFLLSKAVN